MVGRHHRLYRHEFEQVLGVGDGQGGLACCDSWGRKESDMTEADFIFLGSKIAADGDCSHKIKRYLLLGRKAMTNLDSILKSIDITLSTKVSQSKLWFFQ